MKTVIDTFKPVHIGSGDNYTLIECFVDGNRLKRVIPSSLDLGMFEKDLIELGDIRDENEFRRRIAKIENTLKRGDVRYEFKINSPRVELFKVGRDIKGNKKFTIENIREQIKTRDVPFIPGSSIKGAIRTALLWYHMRDKSNLADLKTQIKRELNKKNRKYILKDYLDSFFSVGKDRKSDPRFDLLKFLDVSDFMPLNYLLTLENVKTYSLRKEGFLPKPYPNYVEAMNGSFLGEVRISNQLKVALKDDRYYDQKKLRSKLAMLGLYGESIESTLENEKKVIDHLKRVLREHNEWCLNKELEICGKDRRLVGVINEIKEENKKSGLLRVGFGVGTLYQTLIKLIEEDDVELAENIVNNPKLKITRKKRVIDKRTRKNLFPPYPKTLEFTHGDAQPLGWLKLEEYGN